MKSDTKSTLLEPRFSGNCAHCNVFFLNFTLKQIMRHYINDHFRKDPIEKWLRDPKLYLTKGTVRTK